MTEETVLPAEPPEETVATAVAPEEPVAVEPETPAEPVAPAEPEAPLPEAPPPEEATIDYLAGVEGHLSDLIDYLGTVPDDIPHLGQAVDHLRDARLNLFPAR